MYPCPAPSNAAYLPDHLALSNQSRDLRCPESVIVKLSELTMGSDTADGEHGNCGQVLVHVYDLDPYTGWANGAVMRGLELGIYHCAVEIYGTEWSFQYIDTAWDDHTLTGVCCNAPKQRPGYIYRESCPMGVSPLQREEICDVIHSLMADWRANGYHITRRNCLHFAEVLIGKLRVQVEFPIWIKQLCETSKSSRVVDYMLDNLWGMHKQVATWKTKPEQVTAWMDVSRYTPPGDLGLLSSCSCETQKKKKKERSEGNRERSKGQQKPWLGHVLRASSHKEKPVDQTNTTEGTTEGNPENRPSDQECLVEDWATWEGIGDSYYGNSCDEACADERPLRNMASQWIVHEP